MSSSAEKLLKIGKEFQDLQEQRVKTYATLQTAHKEYLKTAPEYEFKAYREEVAKATQTFKSISERILKLQSGAEESELNQFISQVQELERKKLSITVQAQLARQKVQDDEESNEDIREFKRLNKELVDLAAEINDVLDEIRYFLADLKDNED